MSIVEAGQSEDVWSSDEGSQIFRNHLEEEIHCCQSSQQSILDLVRVCYCTSFTA